MTNGPFWGDKPRFKRRAAAGDRFFQVAQRAVFYHIYFDARLNKEAIRPGDVGEITGSVPATGSARRGRDDAPWLLPRAVAVQSVLKGVPVV